MYSNSIHRRAMSVYRSKIHKQPRLRLLFVSLNIQLILTKKDIACMHLLNYLSNVNIFFAQTYEVVFFYDFDKSIEILFHRYHYGMFIYYLFGITL